MIFFHPNTHSENKKYQATHIFVARTIRTHRSFVIYLSQRAKASSESVHKKECEK